MDDEIKECQECGSLGSQCCAPECKTQREPDPSLPRATAHKPLALEGRSLGDICRDLSAAMKDVLDEGISVTGWDMGPAIEHRHTYKWPDKYRWIACYVVTGRSEGHYVHVDLIIDDSDRAMGDGRRLSVFLAKTFQGRTHGYEIARQCAELLEA